MAPTLITQQQKIAKMQGQDFLEPFREVRAKDNQIAENKGETGVHKERWQLLICCKHSHTPVRI